MPLNIVTVCKFANLYAIDIYRQNRDKKRLTPSNERSKPVFLIFSCRRQLDSSVQEA